MARLVVILGFIAGMGVLFIKVSAQLDNEQRMRSALLGAALSHYDSRSVYLNRNSWMRVCGDTSKYQLIPPQDLRSFNSMSRDTLETIDEVLQQLPASSQEPWRVRRALISACSERAKLFEAYWDEWHASGVNRHKARQNHGRKRRCACRAKSTRCGNRTRSCRRRWMKRLRDVNQILDEGRLAAKKLLIRLCERPLSSP